MTAQRGQSARHRTYSLRSTLYPYDPFLTVYHDHAMNHAWVHGWTDVRSELLRHGPWRMGMAMEPDAIFNYVNYYAPGKIECRVCEVVLVVCDIPGRTF